MTTTERTQHRLEPCHETIRGTQSLCTRARGHAGDHRCSAADVDARLATVKGDRDAVCGVGCDCEKGVR